MSCKCYPQVCPRICYLAIFNKFVNKKKLIFIYLVKQSLCCFLLDINPLFFFGKVNNGGNIWRSD